MMYSRTLSIPGRSALPAQVLTERGRSTNSQAPQNCAYSTGQCKQQGSHMGLAQPLCSIALKHCLLLAVQPELVEVLLQTEALAYPKALLRARRLQPSAYLSSTASCQWQILIAACAPYVKRSILSQRGPRARGAYSVTPACPGYPLGVRSGLHSILLVSEWRKRDESSQPLLTSVKPAKGMPHRYDVLSIA